MEVGEKMRLNQPVRRKYVTILKQINHLAKEMADLSDGKLQAKTAQFKERLVAGESLDDILPEAFAVVREADKRVLGYYPYDVQVLGGIVLHQGEIAEMKTGEGKTLTATLPLYLNALNGAGAMIVTTNDYLSKRDYEEMSPVFQWLGLSVSNAIEDTGKDNKLTALEKRAIYDADIIYTTHAGYGFDYLFENLAASKDDQYLRNIDYVIIDEIDEVLLDGAQTPLVISGMPRVQSNLYIITDQFIRTLDENIDYQFDEDRDNVWLTKKGIRACERYFKIDNLFDPKNIELNRHVFLALRANFLYEKNRNYIVSKGEVKLLNEQTGRIMEGTKLQSGYHQALEAKEEVELTANQRAMASITYQNLFKRFPKIAGMSGTAKVAEAEFQETYGLNVTVVPTNKPVARIDEPDQFFMTLEEKVTAVIDLVNSVHATGQPILLATGSVGMSKLYSDILLSIGIPHNVLNAYNLPKEAMIIKEAGQLGAVTIGTSIAGRGTDIKLGNKVKEIGGLYVIGTERMESKRIDLQLRGRSGRQGDPGKSKFFGSLEDQLITKWSEQQLSIDKYNQGNRPLSQKKLIRIFDLAQDASDSAGRSNRHMSMEFDESLRIQREIIYQDRSQIINGDRKLSFEMIRTKVDEAFDIFLRNNYPLTKERLKRYIFDHLSYQLPEEINQVDLKNLDEVKQLLHQIFADQLHTKQLEITDPDLLEVFLQKAVLKSIDEGWIEQVDYMEQYKKIVTSRQVAQRNVMTEYEKEATRAFKRMRENIYTNMVKHLALSYFERNQKGEWIIQFS